ncbi:hypothetical protein ACFSM5_00380 [Lacibacterium aquatile]|uniref:Uncharacterized protein n=1 Tax=Lacibacterium aquatile TaxID=1168082 RepID=A0ABW5DJS0_9PROT
MRFVLGLLPAVLLMTAEPSLAQRKNEQALFDAPQETLIVKLPASAQTQNLPASVTCVYYPGFLVKQVDIGEKGAESLAIVPVAAQKPPCELSLPGEVHMQDWRGYFLGVKGSFVFFDADDGFNGGVPFAVFPAQGATGGNKLIEDSRKSFEAVELEGTDLVLRYDRVLSLDCSLQMEKTCWIKAQAVTGLPEDRKPDCGDAYAKNAPDSPDVPSVLSYPAELRLTASEWKISVRRGDVACYPAN